MKTPTETGFAFTSLGLMVGVFAGVIMYDVCLVSYSNFFVLELAYVLSRARLDACLCDAKPIREREWFSFCAFE